MNKLAFYIQSAYLFITVSAVTYAVSYALVK